MDLGLLEQRFREYVRPFLERFPRDPDHENVLLKLEHTLRVLDEAERIVSGEGLEGRTADLALAGALFHDIGRFGQYARYRTYSDRQSKDHGDLGAEVLTAREGRSLVQGLDEDFVRDLAVIVAQHNKRILSPDLDPLVRTALHVVRDADKLDIVSVVIEYLRPGKPYNPVICLGLNPDPAHYSVEVLHQILSGTDVDYKDMRWTNDFRLLLCSWAGALVFETSRRRYSRLGYPEILLAGLPRDKAFDPLRRWMDGILGSKEGK